MTAVPDPAPDLEATLAEIRAALAQLPHSRRWRVHADAIRDEAGACIAWHPGSSVGHRAFRYITACSPVALAALVAELDRLRARRLSAADKPTR